MAKADFSDNSIRVSYALPNSVKEICHGCRMKKSITRKFVYSKSVCSENSLAYFCSFWHWSYPRNIQWFESRGYFPPTAGMTDNLYDSPGILAVRSPKCCSWGTRDSQVQVWEFKGGYLYWKVGIWYKHFVLLSENALRIQPNVVHMVYDETPPTHDNLFLS